MSDPRALRLRPMTPAEFDAYRDRLVGEYAAEQVAAGEWRADEAHAKSLEDIGSLLAQGLATENMLLFIAESIEAGPVPEGRGASVGYLWLRLADPVQPQAAWIYDIEVHEERRGQGWGRVLLSAAEQEVRRRGATAVNLKVFGPNAAARRLYESAGYEVVRMHMRKELPPG